MDVAAEELGQRPPCRGMPAALLECLVVMRIGAETALELEFAEHPADGEERMESHE